MVWIPQGFGHGFAARSETVAFTYKVTDYYSPKAERDCALGTILSLVSIGEVDA